MTHPPLQEITKHAFTKALCIRRKRKAKAKGSGTQKYAKVRGRLDVFKDSVTYEVNSPYAIYSKKTFQEFDTKSIPFNTKNGLTQATFEKNILYIFLSFINCICRSKIPHNFTSLPGRLYCTETMKGH